MIERWQDVDDLAVDVATADLEHIGEVIPLLVAFAGTELLLCADVRPFAKGAHHGPIIELLALTTPLDADRVAFAITGRLTSLQDPIPPVTRDADLRQRALVVELADGSEGPVRHRSIIHPFELGAGRVMWHDPVHLEGGQGWIRDILHCVISNRAELVAQASDDALREQAQRCVALGHGLHLGTETAGRLGLSDAARS